MNGLTLLAPAGLFALAALAVPVLIHLFSRSRGRRVLVGNIALYRQARRQRVSEPRPVQWLLLLLRLALLTVAAILLAGLARNGLETLEGDTAYVTPEWLAAQPRDAARAPLEVDQLFLLADGVPALETSPDGSIVPPPVPPYESGRTDSWTLLAERIASVRHTGAVHVFALATGGQFPDRAPALPPELQWHLADAPPAADPAPAGLSVRVLHAPEREADAALIVTALEALSRHRRVALALSTAPVSRAGPERSERDDGAVFPDLGPGTPTRSAVVWLAPEPAPPTLAADVVLEDRAPGPGEPVDVRVAEPVALAFRTRPASPAEGAVAWRAMDGAPVLQSRTVSGQRRWMLLDQLGSGSGGGTDGLAAQAGFPDFLLALLMGDDSGTSGLASAAADPVAATARTAPAMGGPARPLAPWLALTMALLLGLERWLSERPRSSDTPSDAPSDAPAEDPS